MLKRVVLPKLLFTLILLGFTVSVIGQPGPNRRGALSAPPVDLSGMRSALANTDDNREKLKIYGRELVRTRGINPDTTAQLLTEMREINGAEEEYIRAYEYMMRSIRIRRMDPDSALSYARSANVLLHPDFDAESYIRNSIQIASLLSQMYEPIESQTILIELENVVQRYAPDNQSLYIQLKKELGSLYNRAGATSLAIKALNEILELELDDQQRCPVMLSLANAYSRDEEYQKAIETLEPCQEIAGVNPNLKMAILSSIASYYQRAGELDQAILFYERSLATFQSESVRMPGLNFRRILLAEAYLQNGDIARADSLKSEILAYRDRATPQQQIYKFVFLSELELKKKNYQKSVEFADDAIQLAQNAKLENMLQDVHNTKSVALEKLGDYEGSIQALREFDSLNRSREEVVKQRELSEYNIRYQLNVRENELRKASATIVELSNQKKLLVALFIIVLLITLFFLMRNRMKMALGIERTRNQIARDLHDDLSGTLSSISFFSEAASRHEKEQEVNDHFLKMIGKSAHEAKEKINDIIWAIDPEKDDWEDFAVKCKRFASDTFDSKDIDYEITIDQKNLKKRNIKLRQHLWLMLKELTTNIARHSQASKASIKLEVKNEILFLTVWDNGVGIDKKARDSGNGIQNIYKRTEELGAKADLETGKDGTRWLIRISA